MKHAYLLTSKRCFLHVIDVQESLMRQIHGADQVIATIKLLLKCAPVLGLPVIANTQYKKGLGLYDPTLEEMVGTIPRPDKVEFNALANNETAALVDELPAEVDTIILTGVETHICIYQTAMGALARGLQPWIVSDGVSSRSPDHHQDGLNRLAAAGASVGPAEMLIYELLGKAGSEKFRSILPFILEQGKSS